MPEFTYPDPTSLTVIVVFVGILGYFVLTAVHIVLTWIERRMAFRKLFKHVGTLDEAADLNADSLP